MFPDVALFGWLLCHFSWKIWIEPFWISWQCLTANENIWLNIKRFQTQLFWIPALAHKTENSLIISTPCVCICYLKDWFQQCPISCQRGISIFHGNFCNCEMENRVDIADADISQILPKRHLIGSEFDLSCIDHVVMIWCEYCDTTYTCTQGYNKNLHNRMTRGTV